jgi:hypothetical protein
VQRPVAPGERRERREQPEVDAERVGVAAPRLDAVEAHPDEHHDDVGEHEDRQRPRLARRRPAQLADAEPDDPDRRRPAPQPGRVGERLGQLVAAEAARQPAGAAADRAPRAEQAPDVAEQQGRARHADPEHDVDRGRREVVALVVGAGEPRVDGDDEREQAQRAEDGVDAGGEREQPPLAPLLQPRRRPQRGQRDEGDDEDARRRRPEHRFGDRQVGASDDAVGEDEHGAGV